MSLHFGIRLHFRANKLVQFARVHVSLHFLIGILCIFCMQCVALLGALLGAAFPNENVRRGVLFLSRKPLVCTLLGTLSVHQLVENSDFSFALDNEALSRLFIRPGVWERAKQAGSPNFAGLVLGCIDRLYRRRSLQVKSCSEV